MVNILISDKIFHLGRRVNDHFSIFPGGRNRNASVCLQVEMLLSSSPDFPSDDVVAGLEGGVRIATDLKKVVI